MVEFTSRVDIRVVPGGTTLTGETRLHVSIPDSFSSALSLLQRLLLINKSIVLKGANQKRLIVTCCYPSVTNYLVTGLEMINYGSFFIQMCHSEVQQKLQAIINLPFSMSIFKPDHHEDHHAPDRNSDLINDRLSILNWMPRGCEYSPIKIFAVCGGDHQMRTLYWHLECGWRKPSRRSPPLALFNRVFTLPNWIAKHLLSSLYFCVSSRRLADELEYQSIIIFSYPFGAKVPLFLSCGGGARAKYILTFIVNDAL